MFRKYFFKTSKFWVINGLLAAPETGPGSPLQQSSAQPTSVFAPIPAAARSGSKSRVFRKDPSSGTHPLNIRIAQFRNNNRPVNLITCEPESYAEGVSRGKLET
jgi:hypothetical protein